MKDYYKILGVNETATDDEIRRAFRKLAKQYHPDANPNNKLAESKFKEISEAHDVLSDKKKRAQYGQMRRYDPGNYRGEGARAGGQPYNVDDISSIFGEFGGFGSFADIFSSIFGGAGQGGQRGFSEDTIENDIHAEIEIPFETAMSGGSVQMNIDIPATCEICHGSGVQDGSSMTICPDCSGRGTISYSHGNFAVSLTCPRCLGRGKISGQSCRNCGGQGQVTAKKTISVKIPAGIPEGKQIRLKGLGRNKSSDLYLRVNITPHHFFWREGNNIHCRVPVSLDQAIKGARIRIKTIAGKKVDLKIPPKSKSGAKFRLKGFGLAVGGKKGDQVVELAIKKPDSMSDDEKNLYQEMTS